MDLVKYDKATFDKITDQINELKAELDLENVVIIPLSATEGDNVTVKSENIPWYDGKTLLDYLETVDIKSSDNEKGFYMPVQRVCRPDHTFRGFQGQIESGEISVGDEITTLPSNEKAKVKQILVVDRDSKTAKVGQPATITLDKEVDVSRGCVLTKDSEIGVYKKLKASLLWMDDNTLTEGTDYLVKLGTKTIPAIVTKIEYAVDVNTGEHIQKDELNKNEIALCDILLTEPIVVDKFDNHKTLGELILIDRVTNMTSACGVVEDTLEKADYGSHKASFKNGEVEARGDIFEEFYYDSASQNVLKYQPVNNTYSVGDTIPTSGESYNYPDSFDIIVLRDDVAVKVRDKKITEIIPTSEYQYGNVPVVNGRGFEVNASSDEDIKSFLAEYKAYEEDNNNDFFTKWLDFDTYRKVVFSVK